MEEWRDWVGRTWTISEWLDPQQANRMAATLDRPLAFVAGDELPLGWHWLYFHDVVRASDLGADGHPALGVTMPPVPLHRRMWASGRLAFEAPLTLGAEATMTTTIADVVAKEGRTGPLFFVTVEHGVATAGVPALVEQQTIVYREAHAAAAARAAAPDDAEFQASWTFDSTALFRYSGLTFNGHRIHYDADYAREVEGYPGLVVHGPLLATLGLDLLTRQGLAVREYAYQARSPIFVDEAFTVAGRRSAEGADAWVRGADGRLAMTMTGLRHRP